MSLTRTKARNLTYKSDATGGVVRTVHDKFSETVSVKDFGAVGDGVTDDTAAIQAADAAAVSVYIPEGIYRIRSSIALTADYVFERGGVIAPDSLYTVTWSGSVTAGDYRIFDGNFVVSKVHRLNEVRITWFGAVSSDLDTDMGDTTLADANARAIRQANAMTNIGIPNGIYVTPVLKIPTGLFLVDDDNNSGDIINVGSYATIKGEGWSSVIRPVNSGKAFSIIKCDTDGASNIIIDDLQLYGEASLQTNTQHGIDMSPPSSPIIYSYIGRGVHIKEMKGNGIRVTGQGMDNSTIEPRLVRDSTLHNLFVSACDRLTVRDGVYRTAKSGNGGALFDGTGCLSAIIKNNQFDENNQNGLLISNINGRFYISNNRCSGNGLNGIYLDRCDLATVTGNYCEQNTQDGFLIDQCDNIQVNKNYSRSNQRFGIIFGTTANSQIHDNYVVSNGTLATNTYDGINIQSNSDNNSVQGNFVRGSDHRYGIAIDDGASGSNLVTNNDLLNSGTTGSLLDSGTGTVTTAGNRV